MSSPPDRALRRPVRLALLAAVAAPTVLWALAGMGFGQQGFRVTYTVGANTGTHVEITGTVVNENRVDAVEVSVTAEALNASGKTIARGITYVTSKLPPGGSATFVAKVPAMPATASYRTHVSSFRFAQSLQGP